MTDNNLPAYLTGYDHPTTNHLRDLAPLHAAYVAWQNTYRQHQPTPVQREAAVSRILNEVTGLLTKAGLVYPSDRSFGGAGDEVAYRPHPPAELTGGSVPAHIPGAYPRLSCCGGPVVLVKEGE